MERLYAVPSEKLRVWTVWLTKVGEIADEWQKWLHAHIDFTVRLADHLQAAEDAIRRSKGEEEEPDPGDKEDETKELDEVVDPAPEPLVEDESDVREIFTAEKGEAESEMHMDPSTETGAADMDSQIDSSAEEGAESEMQVDPSAEEETVEDAAPSKEDVEEPKEKSDDTETSETNKETNKPLGTWPIGQAWKHTGPPETPEPPFEPLPLPRNEEEMRQFLKEFTHQATIYRSYYKHWDETADQAVKEIGGRLVLATYITRGEACRKSKKKLSTKKSKPKTATSESKAAEPVPEQKSVKSDDSEQYFTPEASISDTPTVIEVPPTVNEDAPTVNEDAPTVNEDAPTVNEDAATEIENAPDPSSTNPVPSSRGTSKQSSKQPSADKKDVDKKDADKKDADKKDADDADDVDDWIKDNARASEPIPYLFYVKAEPDIEIAIEHDDEEVIAADPDRESIVGNYKRLFYNLNDKPCKGGKPWL